jgi:AcrR family transcriptional regulator
MRQRLLLAALDVFLLSDMTQPPVIDDVIRKARVARGTFYKYFASLEQVLEELGQQMADAMLDRCEVLLRELHDPAARLAAGPLLSLTQAARQPRRVNFTARVNYVDYLSRNTRVNQVISTCLEQARATGVARVASAEAMTDVIIGTTLEGCRRLLHADAGNTLDSHAYIDELVLMMLQACGLPPAEARLAIDRAQVQLTALDAERQPVLLS